MSSADRLPPLICRSAFPCVRNATISRIASCSTSCCRRALSARFASATACSSNPKPVTFSAQTTGRADPGARQPDAAQGGQDCERPDEGDRVAEDAGEPISAAASRGSDGRLRLHVPVARTRRRRRAAVIGSRRGVRQCGKPRHLRQRMANALPPPGPKSLVADFGGAGVSDCAVGSTARDISGSNPSRSATI